MIVVLLALAGVAIGVPLGIYGRWSGWGFGLDWWGRPTPVRVTKVTPLTGAALTGHSDQSTPRRPPSARGSDGPRRPSRRGSRGRGR